MRRRLSDDEILEVAVSMVNRLGTADLGLGYTMVAAAQIAGVGRQALYHHWSSVTELTADLARQGATARPGWRHRLLGTDPTRSMIGAVADTTLEPDVSPVIWAAVSGWPPDHPVRRDLVAWERAWFESLARWIRAGLAAEGRPLHHEDDALLAAVALTAAVEGSYLASSWFHGRHLPDWTVPPWFVADRARSNGWFGRVFPQATGEPVARGPVAPFPMPAPVGPEPGPAKQRIVDALLVAFGSPPTEPGPVPGRVVDLSRLSRELGITVRSIYNRWPRVVDLNGDILLSMLASLRRSQESLIGAAVKQSWDPAAPSHEQVLISLLDAMIAPPDERTPVNHFAMVVAGLADEVRVRSASYVQEWADGLATSILAMFAGAGQRVHDDVPPGEMVGPLMSGLMGMQRIACMHPDLLRSTRTHQGREVPALAFTLYRGLLGAVTDPPRVTAASPAGPYEDSAAAHPEAAAG